MTSTTSRSPSLSDVRWSASAYSPRSFAAEFADRLPQITRVEPLRNGHVTQNGASTRQPSIILVLRVVNQERVHANYVGSVNQVVSIEVASPELFAVRHPGRHTKFKKYKTLRKILSKYEKDLPITVDQKPRAENQRRSRDVGGYNEQHQAASCSLALTSLQRHRYLAFNCIVNDILSDELSYMDVDMDSSQLVLRVAESLDGDVTGFGWQMLKENYRNNVLERMIKMPKQLKPEGPSGFAVVATGNASFSDDRLAQKSTSSMTLSSSYSTTYNQQIMSETRRSSDQVELESTRSNSLQAAMANGVIQPQAGNTTENLVADPTGVSVVASNTDECDGGLHIVGNSDEMPNSTTATIDSQSSLERSRSVGSTENLNSRTSSMNGSEVKETGRKQATGSTKSEQEVNGNRSIATSSNLYQQFHSIKEPSAKHYIKMAGDFQLPRFEQREFNSALHLSKSKCGRIARSLDNLLSLQDSFRRPQVTRKQPTSGNSSANLLSDANSRRSGVVSTDDEWPPSRDCSYDNDRNVEHHRRPVNDYQSMSSKTYDSGTGSSLAGAAASHLSRKPTFSFDLTGSRELSLEVDPSRIANARHERNRKRISSKSLDGDFYHIDLVLEGSVMQSPVSDVTVSSLSSAGLAQPNSFEVAGNITSPLKPSTASDYKDQPLERVRQTALNYVTTIRVGDNVSIEPYPAETDHASKFYHDLGVRNQQRRIPERTPSVVIQVDYPSSSSRAVPLDLRTARHHHRATDNTSATGHHESQRRMSPDSHQTSIYSSPALKNKAGQLSPGGTISFSIGRQSNSFVLTSAKVHQPTTRDVEITSSTKNGVSARSVHESSNIVVRPSGRSPHKPTVRPPDKRASQQLTMSAHTAYSLRSHLVDEQRTRNRSGPTPAVQTHSQSIHRSESTSVHNKRSAYKSGYQTDDAPEPNKLNGHAQPPRSPVSKKNDFVQSSSSTRRSFANELDVDSSEFLGEKREVPLERNGSHQEKHQNKRVPLQNKNTRTDAKTTSQVDRPNSGDRKQINLENTVPMTTGGLNTRPAFPPIPMTTGKPNTRPASPPTAKNRSIDISDVDLQSVRRDLKPVSSRRRAVSDNEELIEELVKQTFAELDAETNKMLVELGRARSIVAEQVMATSPNTDRMAAVELLKQLTANAGRQNGSSLAAGTFHQNSTGKNGAGKPEVGADRPEVLTETKRVEANGKPLQNGVKSPETSSSKKLSASGQPTTRDVTKGVSDENNNNDNDDNGLSMSRDQLERIKLWRTEPGWQASDDVVDGVRQLDDYLDELDVDQSSEQYHSSSSSCISDGPISDGRSSSSEYEDDTEGQQATAKFEYFFGFEVDKQ